jgi:hypothetical protein
MIVPAPDNIWICELGRRGVDGDFPAFVRRILGAQLDFSGLRVSYHSPSQGLLEFGWEGPLRQDGRDVMLRDYPRYDNPYAQARFPPDRVEISLGEHDLRLDWPSAKRQT